MGVIPRDVLGLSVPWDVSAGRAPACPEAQADQFPGATHSSACEARGIVQVGVAPSSLVSQSVLDQIYCR